jgi:ubiquinone/menaquinone biosynthesis C-methylase UbiE
MNNLFDRHFEKYDIWYEEHKFAYLSELEAIKQVLPKKGTGLEIGVGTGRFAAPLGIQFGIDPSEKMLKIAKERGINVQQGSGENLPFSNASFDYIAIIITICFVKNPQKVIKEACRVLKKHGKIILGIVDKNSFLGKFYQSKKSVFYKQAHFFTAEELAGLLVSEKFGNISYYQTLYDLPDKITSVQKPEKSYGKGGFVVIAAHKQ